MICKKFYNLPRRWAYEPIDAPGAAWDDFLGNPIATVLFVHYLHIFIHGFYPTIDTMVNGVVLTFIYHSFMSKIIFFCVLASVTGAYGLYFWPRIRRLRNPRVYLRYIAPDLVRFVSLQGIIVYLISMTIFPFGICYLVILSFTLRMHVEALERMNVDGEI